MPTLIDITGQRLGRLIVLRRSYLPCRRVRWLCQCDCGKQTIVGSAELRRGATVSCGCAHYGPRAEHIRAKLSAIRKKHGYAAGDAPKDKKRLYKIWSSMRSRCNNSNTDEYKHYGGRGISVCQRWHSFENFVADMSPRPEGYSIERIDNDGNYEPANCKWIPRRDQLLNRRPYQPRQAKTTAGITAPKQ